MAFNTPTQITDNYIAGCPGKATSPIWRLFVLGIMAGIFIGFGACVSSTAAHALGDAGMVRMVSGLIFPIGLVMVVLLGTELFTGNALMVTAVIAKKITVGQLLRNWVVVYAGNFVGAVLLAAAMAFFGQFNIGGGDLAVYTAKVAAAKDSLPWMNAFVLAIFCNFLVCTAIYLGSTAQDTAGRIAGLMIPIFAFVTAGLEHSIADMYYCPAGIFAFMNPAYTDMIAAAGINTAVLDFGTYITANLVPVTFGNIVGGVIVGVVMYLAHSAKEKAAK